MRDGKSHNSFNPPQRDDSLSWRRDMRLEIGWLLLAKLAGLFALWALFFSAAHHVDANQERTAEKFAITPASGDGDHD